MDTQCRCEVQLALACSGLRAKLAAEGTFVLAELDVGEQPDLDDLPEQTQDQVLPALLQVLGPDVDHVAADGGGGVQGQVQVLLRARGDR